MSKFRSRLIIQTILSLWCEVPIRVQFVTGAQELFRFKTARGGAPRSVSKRNPTDMPLTLLARPLLVRYFNTEGRPSAPDEQHELLVTVP
ncbi:hypothetical protein ABIA45_007512 [Bradyrhizobium sp. USDA 336]